MNMLKHGIPHVLKHAKDAEKALEAYPGWMLQLHP